jgi:UDPglucose--hexose-1-phosphate uridylyltransferase
MSRLRRSAHHGPWSLVAPARSRRPRLAPAAVRNPLAQCHFCPGNERETEPEVFALRPNGSHPDSPEWKVRVVPNKYPAVSGGRHEVVIESPVHGLQIESMPVRELEAVLTVYRERVRTLRRRSDVQSVALFRNEGSAAGASQEHPHAQIIALPIVPGRLRTELTAANRYFQQRGQCLTCDALVADATGLTQRLVARNSDFTALTSFAPRFPYETWIVPNTHAHDYRDITGRHLRSLASILRHVLAALRSALDRFPYNLILITAPAVEGPIDRAFHWRLEILPRLTVPSGFEMGSDVFIVEVAPEEAAEKLRAAAAPVSFEQAGP